MTYRFLTLVGSLSLEEQKFWLPNQVVHDPDTWTTSHLLHLNSEYDVLVNKHGYIIQEMYTVETLWLRFPPLSFSYYRPSIVFTSLMCEIRSRLKILIQLCHHLNVSCLGRWWGTGNLGLQTSKSQTITGWWTNWFFMYKKLFPLQVFKTLTLVLVPTILTRPFCPLKWRLLNLVMVISQLANWTGNLLDG